MQESWESRDVVRMGMRYADCREAPESPTRLSPGNLRPLATIEESQMPIDPDEKTGEPAARQRHHAARPQQHGIDH